MRVQVARIGRAHGLAGEVTVQLHTDAPADRFRPGSVLTCEPAPPQSLTVATAREHQGTWLVSFAGAGDRTAAEALRGVRLFADVALDPEPEAWYEAELLDLPVYDPGGSLLGRVVALHTRPAQDLLEVRLDDGRGGLVPFVTALVPVVDVAAGRIVIDVPDGLFDLGGSA